MQNTSRVRLLGRNRTFEIYRNASSLPQTLLRPYVLWAARERVLSSKIHYLKFFAELFAKSSPPEAFASSPINYPKG